MLREWGLFWMSENALVTYHRCLSSCKPSGSLWSSSLEPSQVVWKKIEHAFTVQSHNATMQTYLFNLDLHQTILSHPNSKHPRGFLRLAWSVDCPSWSAIADAGISLGHTHSRALGRWGDTRLCYLAKIRYHLFRLWQSNQDSAEHLYAKSCRRWASISAPDLAAAETTQRTRNWSCHRRNVHLLQKALRGRLLSHSRRCGSRQRAESRR